MLKPAVCLPWASPVPPRGVNSLPPETARFVVSQVLLPWCGGRMTCALRCECDQLLGVAPSAADSIFQGTLGKRLTTLVPEPRIELSCPNSNSVAQLRDCTAGFYSPAPFSINQK